MNEQVKGQRRLTVSCGFITSVLSHGIEGCTIDPPLPKDTTVLSVTLDIPRDVIVLVLESASWPVAPGEWEPRFTRRTK